MSLRHAILGLLSFEDMSGYTLKTRYFDKSIAHFWPADQAQIYRSLQALEADAEVVSRIVPGESRPQSRVYALTEAGRAALTDWLAAPRKLATQKDAFLVQLYFGRLLSRDQLVHVLRARRAEHENLRCYYENLHLPVADSPEMRQQLRLGGLTLDFARRRERMMVEWLDASIAQVQSWPEPEE